MSQESTKNLGGRPRAYIDYEKLEKLCQIHCTGEECAAILDVDYDTLNRNLIEDGHGGFAEYFKRYSANGKASLRRRQFQAAMDGNTTMLVWMGKQLLGQSDKTEIQQQSQQPIHIEIVNPYASDTAN